MSLARIGSLMACLCLLTLLARGETPLEAVKEFEKVCAAKDQSAALLRMVDPGSLPGQDGAYFQQKARRLIENSAREGWKVEPVSEKIEGAMAAVMLVSTGPEAKREVETLYLRKAGEQWRIIPFSNWRKLPLPKDERAALEKLETWAEAEEQRLSPAGKSDWE